MIKNIFAVLTVAISMGVASLAIAGSVPAAGVGSAATGAIAVPAAIGGLGLAGAAVTNSGGVTVTVPAAAFSPATVAQTLAIGASFNVATPGGVLNVSVSPGGAITITSGAINANGGNIQID